MSALNALITACTWVARSKQFQLLVAGIAVFTITGCASNYVGTVTQPVQLVGWPPGWNHVQPGMSREQVHQLLGSPNQEDGSGMMELYQTIDTQNNQGKFEYQIHYDAGGYVAKRVFQLIPY
jgi:outer membrane protein assembly factor BamE (lipoprotein component of BamABCDE complex)